MTRKSIEEDAARNWNRTQERIEELEAAQQITVYTDATRPATANTGTVIYNSDDGNLNIFNGADWILPDGTVT